MNYQWYPGHMTKAKRMMQENIKLIDMVIEILDARIPFSSKNPDIDELSKNKLHIVLLNKADLADENINKKWKRYLEEQGVFVMECNSKNATTGKKVYALIEEACKEKRERDRKRGIVNRPVRAMIAGIPNVGKSTFINGIAGKACTKTGNKPGVTKGKQWIRVNSGLELLDTPGILWPKFEDETVGRNLAFIGSMNDEVIITEELAYTLLQELVRLYPGIIRNRYGIDENTESNLLEEIARIRKCFLKGDVLDIKKASLLVLDDFRSGRLGRISMEEPGISGKETDES